MAEKKPVISAAPNGPYIVVDLERLAGANGPLPVQGRVALCRCGASANKPFCDGAHARISFTSENSADPDKDKRDSYAGKTLTVHDNRSICAHAGVCTDRLPSVFRMKKEPWIDPDEATAAEVIEIVKSCPSGALSFTTSGVEHRELDANPGITVVKGGPYVVAGGPQLVDIPRSEGAAEGHFTLCRCGASKNKPFCDGAHWNVDFDGESEGPSQ